MVSIVVVVVVVTMISREIFSVCLLMSSSIMYVWTLLRRLMPFCNWGTQLKRNRISQTSSYGALKSLMNSLLLVSVTETTAARSFYF